MSRSWALVKFINTGNIYIGLYDGTTDVLYPYVLPLEKCWDEEHKVYSPFKFIPKISTQEINYNKEDVSPVEIYSDYGGGFFWEGEGIEGCGFILSQSRCPWGNCYPDPWTGDTSDMIEVCDGAPEWAENFMNKLLE